ncbi:hypothetical protein [Flavihumibacter solisilvae]|uniref:hypothetical protein n=1 Tax=Flavihumibacter solisilvae TaxID=1349421 RepID=UPI000AFA046E|nr:hypothetical protein [Flavihumibacter solisilvae]
MKTIPLSHPLAWTFLPAIPPLPDINSITGLPVATNPLIFFDPGSALIKARLYICASVSGPILSFLRPIRKLIYYP